MYRFFLSLFALSSIVLLGAGCTLKFGGAAEGGVFKTIDSGEHWTGKQVIVTPDGKRKNMGNDEVTSLKVDPRNGNNLFAGTLKNGLYTSIDAGETWSSILPGLHVVDIALDSSSRCVAYALTPGRLYKTTNCAKDWMTAYDETRLHTALTSVESDPITPEIVYVTTTDGDILKSNDRGTTWSAVYRLPRTSISDLVIDRWDSNLIYVDTEQNGVFRSRNKGTSWEDITGSLKQDYSSPVSRWIGTLSQKGGLIFVNDKTMYRSVSQGSAWEEVPLLTPQGDAAILSVAINPQNDNEIMYTTPTTFYRTTDGGAHWISHPLPSTRAGAVLMFDPYSTATVYLGTKIFIPDSPFF